jgi:serine/threonine-protein kinase
VKAHEFSVLGPLMGGFGSQAFLGCLHAGDGLIKPAVMVFLADEIVDSPELFKRVWTETELGTQIDHVNVIGVMGLAKLDEGYARVVEYADAESLRSVYRRATTLKKPIPPAIACALVADACMGVHYAHELGATETGEPMIHGGIRPETLQVSFQGMAKVTGYGATTIAEIARKARNADAKDAYTAPEQAYGGRAAASVQTDIYALGCVLYEALTGKAPFAADNDLAEAMIKDELQKRGEHDDVNDDVAAIVLRATKKKSAERYTSALEMRHELKEKGNCADERAIRRFMDELFPPDTVPRATRDQMLIAAREKPPAPTGRLLSEIPVELTKLHKERAAALSDAEIEARAGQPVERSGPQTDPNLGLVAARASQLPETAPPAPAALQDATGDVQQAPPSGLAHETAPIEVGADAAPEAPEAPAAGAARGQSRADRQERQRARRSSADTYPPGHPGGMQARARPDTARADPWTSPPASAPPVVYRTPPGLLVGLGLAAGVAVALVVVLVMKDGDDEKPQPQVIVQQVPTPPPVVPPPVAPPVEPAPPVPTTSPPTGTGKKAPRDDDDPPPAKKTGPGTINISADPASLAITVDGKSVGTGSATWTGNPGSHTIVGKDAAQGITVKKTVKLKPGSTMSVELEARKGKLAFDQLPDGVDVYVDGKKVGKTPMPALEIWAGPHKLKVKKGDSEIPYNIDLPPGREMFLTATFN